jgi:hypothetical protein
VERGVQIFFVFFLFRLKSAFCTSVLQSKPKNDFLRDNYLDNSLHIHWNNNELKHEIFNNKPKPKQPVQLPSKPSPKHPWRKLNRGLSSKHYNAVTKLELLT